MNHRKFFDKSLETLARELENGAREQSRSGHIAGVHKSALSAIEARQRLHRDRVASAIREGHLWPILKEEFARDFSAIFDNLLRLELGVDERFDAPHDGATISGQNAGSLQEQQVVEEGRKDEREEPHAP